MDIILTSRMPVSLRQLGHEDVVSCQSNRRQRYLLHFLDYALTQSIAYWIAFGPHGPRALPPPGETGRVFAYTMAGVAAAGALFAFSRYFARPPPHTMNKEYQEASDEYLKVRSTHPFGNNRDPSLDRDEMHNVTNEHLLFHRVKMLSQSLVFPRMTGRVASRFSPSHLRSREIDSVVKFGGVSEKAVKKAVNRAFESMAFWRLWQPLICKQGFCEAKAKDESWCIDKRIVERTSASNVQRAVSLQCSNSTMHILISNSNLYSSIVCSSCIHVLGVARFLALFGQVSASMMLHASEFRGTPLPNNIGLFYQRQIPRYLISALHCCNTRNHRNFISSLSSAFFLPEKLSPPVELAALDTAIGASRAPIIFLI